MTASDRILERLSKSPVPLAVHELGIYGVSDNAAATRLSELQAQGKVIGVYRIEARFKEWKLAEPKADALGQYLLGGIAA